MDIVRAERVERGDTHLEREAGHVVSYRRLVVVVVVVAGRDPGARSPLLRQPRRPARRATGRAHARQRRAHCPLQRQRLPQEPDGLRAHAAHHAAARRAGCQAQAARRHRQRSAHRSRLFATPARRQPAAIPRAAPQAARTAQRALSTTTTATTTAVNRQSASCVRRLGRTGATRVRAAPAATQTVQLVQHGQECDRCHAYIRQPRVHTRQQFARFTVSYCIIIICIFTGEQVK